MRETLTSLERPKETLALQKILHLPEEPSLTYCEKEVCYIMWHVFHTLQDCLYFCYFFIFSTLFTNLSFRYSSS